MNKKGILWGQRLHNLMLEWGVKEAELLNRSPRTIKKNKEQISSFMRLLGDRWFTADNCNSVLLQGMKFGAHKDPAKRRPWSIGTRRTYAGTLRAFIKWAVLHRHLKENFSPLIIKPQADEKKVRLITSQMAREIIYEITIPKKTHHALHRKQLEERRFYLLTLLYLGLRLREPQSVTSKNLNFNSNKPEVTAVRKGRKSHTLIIPQHLMEEFRKREDWEKVFTASPDGASEAWRDGLAEKGIPHLSLHKFRHIKVVEMLDNGAPVNRVSQFMNHSSSKVTLDIYAKYSTKPIDETFKQYDPLGIEESSHEDVNDTVMDWLKRSGVKTNPHVTVAHGIDEETGTLTVKVIPKNP